MPTLPTFYLENLNPHQYIGKSTAMPVLYHKIEDSSFFLDFSVKW